MLTRRLLVLAAALAACGDDSTGPAGGFDSGPAGGFDSGPAGGFDSGPAGGTDSGPRVDSGPRADGSMPTTPGGIGSSCAMDTDCDGDSMCYTEVSGFEFPGGYCSRMCMMAAECGAGATCAGGGFTGFSGFCAKTCTSDADCRADEGYTCGSLGFGGGSEMYCLPPTGGSGWMRDGGFGGFDGSFPGF
jgi:hypothetical protein